MDRGQFDALTRLIATQGSRRAAIVVVLTAFAGSLFPDFMGSALGKRTRKHRDRGRDGRNRPRRSRANPPPKRRKAKAKNTGKATPNRQPPTQAEATSACCSRSCPPGAGQDLKNCCFEGLNLAGANFSRSNLAGASFRGSVLTNVNFNNANLSKTCLIDADLTGATFSSANLSGAIYCRTRTGPNSVNNSGCGLGTPCCAACDAQHPCAANQVCCAGRCVPGNCCDNGQQSSCAQGQICCNNRCLSGDCCRASDCANEVCEQRACQANRCIYTPVSGGAGPLCPSPRICCQDTEGTPVCCNAGVTNCLPSGICGCGGDGDCAGDEKCCNGTCVARTLCCEGSNGEGCPGDQHCCVSNGNGDCGACCNADQCPDETCESKSCGSDNICAYAPVFGTTGSGCNSVCCRDANANPQCCDAGISVCTASGRCRCTSGADCTSSESCCNGACIANTQCCAGNPSTCPSPGVCQIRACANGACQPRGISGGSCPLAGGGTGVCRDGTCVCPSPRITCNNVCCSEGVTQCSPDGTCPPVLCDVCPSGCRFATVAAAIAGTAAGGTIRICPGTYATLDARVDRNLTIVGAGSGAGGTILDGQGVGRILTIADETTVTIRDLTVTRGFGTQRDNTGANIRVLFDAALTLERVEVTDGVNPSGFGLGAIYVGSGSSLVLKESRVANNLNFSFGGGIMIDDGTTLTLEGSRIEGNSAGFGGGIWTETGSETNLDSRSLVTGNYAFQRRGGGGILNKGLVTGVTASNVSGNTGGNPPVPSNCDNNSGGTGCPA